MHALTSQHGSLLVDWYLHRSIVHLMTRMSYLHAIGAVAGMSTLDWSSPIDDLLYMWRTVSRNALLIHSMSLHALLCTRRHLDTPGLYKIARSRLDIFYIIDLHEISDPSFLARTAVKTLQERSLVDRAASLYAGRRCSLSLKDLRSVPVLLTPFAVRSLVIELWSL
jgi:hypothetical protein